MLRKCKNYTICGFEADKLEFPTYVCSKNGKTYHKNICENCCKRYSNERSKMHYLKNRETILRIQKDRIKNDTKYQLKRKRYLKKYRKENTELVKASQKISQRKPKGRFKKSIKDAKARNIFWSLTFEEFEKIINQPCYYCNYNFCKPVEVGSGLDRLDNSKGYELGNVVSCGKDCNTLRMNILTPEEAKAAIQAILTIRHPTDRASLLRF